ncbi:hypothetical protein [Cyanobium sp. Morenito 9A2]|uniref:hypothetical protein n=1 Tax=Cyanobium sp. Morenito 9A2 TaxID=2823718 RepID=UPI0020CD2639|nr:hypothetical protein [Cyanobium sp. Morenito 9A2]MCP9848953.1 hypothetical protein [Cyanobium sp. Morenito 9A2]
MDWKPRALGHRVGTLLMRWGLALQAPPVAPTPTPSAVQPPVRPLTAPAASTEAALSPQAPAPIPQRPGVRLPLSVERAVQSRNLSVLKREASDALAALGSAHALVTSARLAQLQGLHQGLEQGKVSEQDLNAVAIDYQAWQHDQVRLFDALRLVAAMQVPSGRALDQIDPRLHEAAKHHLEALSIEYQRNLLSNQFRNSLPAAGSDGPDSD